MRAVSRSDGDHFYVYGLVGPKNQIFYVGKGQQDRCYEHAINCEYDTTKKGAYIRGLMDSGTPHSVAFIKKGISDFDALSLEATIINILGVHPNGPLLNTVVPSIPDLSKFSEIYNAPKIKQARSTGRMAKIKEYNPGLTWSREDGENLIQNFKKYVNDNKGVTFKNLDAEVKNSFWKSTHIDGVYSASQGIIYVPTLVLSHIAGSRERGRHLVHLLRKSDSVIMQSKNCIWTTIPLVKKVHHYRFRYKDFETSDDIEFKEAA